MSVHGRCRRLPNGESNARGTALPRGMHPSGGDAAPSTLGHRTIIAGRAALRSYRPTRDGVGESDGARSIPRRAS